MSYTTVIFDMDGTILDTLEDLWIAVNAARARQGLDACTRDHVRRNLGNGMDFLIDHCVPEGCPRAVRDQVMADFKAHYAAHASDHTRPYPGIPELLDELAARGVRRAVVSNKGDFAVQELVDDLFPGRFDFALGERADIARKPAPDMTLAAMRELGATSAECVYVGDSEVDLATAANAGLPCISVDWGFRDRAELVAAGATRIVSTTADLLDAICAKG